MRIILVSIMVAFLYAAEPITVPDSVAIKQYKLKDGRTLEGIAQDNPKRTPGWMRLDLYMNGKVVGSTDLHRDDIESQADIMQEIIRKPPVATDATGARHPALASSAESSDISAWKAQADSLRRQRADLERTLRDELARLERAWRATGMTTISDAEITKVAKDGELKPLSVLASAYNELITSSDRSHASLQHLVHYYASHPELIRFRPHPCPRYQQIQDIISLMNR